MRTDQDNKDRHVRLINFNFVNIATVNTLKGPIPPLVKLVVTARKSGILLRCPEPKKSDKKSLHLSEESQADGNQSESSANELTVLNIS